VKVAGDSRCERRKIIRSVLARPYASR